MPILRQWCCWLQELRPLANRIKSALLNAKLNQAVDPRIRRRKPWSLVLAVSCLISAVYSLEYSLL
ncbi:hypothetical protein NW852_06675, partial [Synechococcus sp. H60.1]|uniref:hypothetical protein n=1 Tax=Synechococcus sp. H60.1 TaxID=2964517 RepID=UPI0039C244E1